MNKDNKLKKKLDEIIEKRKNCIPLTKEEDIFVSETYDKLYLAKFGEKKFEVKTGDEIRKASSFEGTPPKNRGFEGGYDRKADVERTVLARDGKNTAGQPTRKDLKYFSQEGKATPTENTSGSIQADYRTEEYADADNKKYVPRYEEERLANQIEGQHQYENSIRVKDIVVKSVSHLGQDIKIVGQVLKIYKDGKAALVKWATGTMSHEVATDLDVLKAKHSKTAYEEDEVVSPPVRKHTEAEKLAQEINRAQTHFGESSEVGKGIGSAIRAAGKLAGRAAERAGRGISQSGIKAAARHGYKTTGGKKAVIMGQGPGRLRTAGGGEMQSVGRALQGKPQLTHQQAQRQTTSGLKAGWREASKKVTKGEKPPSEWLDRCVERVKESGGADEPYAVCTATYNKMKSLSPEDIQKDESGNEYIKLTAEDFAGICESCVEKMHDQKIKFLKIYLGDLA